MPTIDLVTPPTTEPTVEGPVQAPVGFIFSSEPVSPDPYTPSDEVAALTRISKTAPEGHGVFRVLQAAVESENSLGSAIANGFGIGSYFPPDEKYNPLEDHMVKSRPEAIRQLMKSRSPEETAHLVSKVDREASNLQVLSDAGWGGAAAMMVAGAADPVFWAAMFVPGVAPGRVGSLGLKSLRAAAQTSIARTSLAMAAEGAISETAAEAAKSSTQVTRSVDSSMTNIAVATLLTGIGGAAFTTMSRSRAAKAVKEWENLVTKSEIEFIGPNQHHVPTLEEQDLAAAFGLEKVGVSPEIRTANSPVASVRNIVENLTESSLVRKKNFAGIPTAPGGSVETRIKMWGADRADVKTALDDAFDGHVKNNPAPMKEDAFLEQVSIAMRNGDRHAVPEVQSASLEVRKFYDKIKKEAQSVGQLPEDLKVVGADGYVNRIYNREAVIAKEPEFHAIIEKSLKREQDDAVAQMWGAQAKIDAAHEQYTRASEAHSVSVASVESAKKNIEALRSSVQKETSSFKQHTAVEKTLNSEVSALMGRLGRFKPTDVELSRSLPGAISKLEEKLMSVEKSASEVEGAYEALYKEMERNLAKSMEAPRAVGTLPRGGISTEGRGVAISSAMTALRNKRSALEDVYKNIDIRRENILAELNDLAAKSARGGDIKVAEELGRQINRLMSKRTSVAKKASGIRAGTALLIEKKSGLLESRAEKIAARDEAAKLSKLTENEYKALEAEFNDIKGRAGASPEDIALTARDITERIMGIPSGGTAGQISITRGPFKKRVLTATDQELHAFLDNDMHRLIDSMSRSAVPQIEMARKFGADFLVGNAGESKSLMSIKDEYAKLRAVATSEKERKNLVAHEKSDIADLLAMRDRLLGTYGLPDDPDGWAHRLNKGARQLNYIRMLGGMTISAIPDLAGSVLVNGMKPFGPALKTLALYPSALNLARKEVKSGAIGLDMVLNERVKLLSELTDPYSRGTKAERALEYANEHFAKLALMRQWNAAMKQWTGIMTADRILGACGEWASGAIGRSDVVRLAASGIDEATAKRIARQFAKYGDAVDIRLANTEAWDDTLAVERLRGAILRDTDRAIVTPTVGEKPLWMSTGWGKLLGQFKSFAVSAHHKMLISNLQYRDMRALNGVVLTVSLGAVSYALKEHIAGRQPSGDAAKLIVEGIDKSGVSGFMGDVNNISEKFTGGKFGANALIGAAPMSRYASRGYLGAIGGPTAGLVETAGIGLTALFNGDDKRAVQAARALMPGQNLFYFRGLFDKIQEDITD